MLWLAAALSAIAFSLATNVRGESERAATLSEGVRAQFLAQGAIQRAILSRLSRPNQPAPPRVVFSFPAGEAVVDFVPETARLSLNQGRPEQFMALLLSLGVEPPRAQMITAAIIDWRSPGGGLDPYYLSLTPSFRPRHASFQEVEEALYVQGMTPEIFHGMYRRLPQGGLVRVGAFKDCVSVQGTVTNFDANHAEPALLASLGLPPEAVAALVQLRRVRPLATPADLAQLGPAAGAAGGRLGVGGNTIYTLRATARHWIAPGRLSDLSRTVAATVKFRLEGSSEGEPYEVIRWQDQAWSEVSQWP
ncbi:MAG: type II secretion system protein GspK [Bryobacteraceae bacterium]